MSDRRGKYNSGAPRSSEAARSGGAPSAAAAAKGRLGAMTAGAGTNRAGNMQAGAGTNRAVGVQAGAETNRTVGAQAGAVANRMGGAQAGAVANRTGGAQTGAEIKRAVGAQTAPAYIPTSAEIAKGLYTPDGRPAAAARVQPPPPRDRTGGAPPAQNRSAPQKVQSRGTARDARPTGSGGRPPSDKQRGAPPQTKQQGGKNGKNRSREKNTPGKLRAQTAAERRRHIVERQGFTPEQLEYLRRRSAIKKYYIKKRRISAITLFFTRLMALVIIYATLFAVSSGLFWLGLHSGGRAAGEDVVYQLGENKSDVYYSVETLSYRDKVRGGQICLNFTQLAEYLGFVTTGDASELRYLTKYNGGEEVIFDVGTGSVTINGSMTRMSVPSYYEDGVLYVPLDFVETYINGISLGINEKSGRLVLYRLYTMGIKDEKIYSDITFTLKPQPPSEHIAENSLPADIKLSTEPDRSQAPPVGTDLTG